MQGTVLNQHRSHGAAPFIKPCLNDGAFGGAVRISLELFHIGNQKDGLQKLLDAGFFHGGNRNTRCVAAPFLRDEFVFGQLLHHHLGVSTRFIHFIDGNNDGNFGRLGVVDRFYGLRHNTVIRRDNQHGNIRHLRTACAHGGECFVAGGVQKCNVAFADFNLIGTDVLRNAARLGGSNVGVADSIQQGCFAVIHVTHNHYDRSTRNQIVIFVFTVVDNAVFNGDDNFFLHFSVELHCYKRSSIKINYVVYRCKHTHPHQFFNNFGHRCL